MKKVIVFAIFITVSFVLNAQPGVGCYRASDGFVYSVKNGFGYYELLGTRYPITPTACPRVQLGTPTGSKCQFVALGTLHDEYNYVLYTANGPVRCDIDHYAYAALVICGFIGIRLLRSKV